MTHLDTSSLFQLSIEASGNIPMPFKLDLDPAEEALQALFGPDVLPRPDPPPQPYILIGEASLDSLIQPLPIAWRYDRKATPTNSWMFGKQEILMPFPDQFTHPNAYRHAVVHEVMHWTGGNEDSPHSLNLTRLNRPKWSSYDHEELIAELATAMVLSDLSLLSDWDKNIAADYLHSFLFHRRKTRITPAITRQWDTACKQAEDAVYYFRNGKVPEQQ